MALSAFQNLSLNEICLSVGAATLAGSLIGLERLWRHKSAALKTNTLVSLGACVFGMMSVNSSFLQNWSASQFSIGVITGVGFLGSGIMIHDQGRIQGINSAATVWVSAGVGLACGMGEYALAGVTLVAVLIVQFLHRWIESKVNTDSQSQ
jgi:putative Mg2+ transporter-C (MgtC) family protein